MSRKRKNTANRKLIEAILSTPFIVLGPKKSHRKSAAKKWLRAFEALSK